MAAPWLALAKGRGGTIHFTLGKDATMKRTRCLLTVCVLGAVCLTSVQCSSVPVGVGSGGSGALKVLVTDAPFPFQFIQEAVVTIARVEIRRAGADDFECNGNAACDDGVACNGEETCADQVCLPGAATCEDGFVCDEVNDACVPPCANDDQCVNDEICDEASELCVAPTTGDADPDDGGDGNPFIVIFDGDENGDPRELDLLDLRNGRTDLLADLVVPAGVYTQMRLIVTKGCIKLQDDRLFTLRVPSGAQTGIKLNFTFEVPADEETTLLLDIDLSRAFKPIPGGKIDYPAQIKEFKFSPALAMRLINLADVGAIAGTATHVVAGMQEPVAIAAFLGDVEITSTSTEADGTYTLAGLPPGEYRVVFSVPELDDMEVLGVTVVAAETTDNIHVTFPES